MNQPKVECVSTGCYEMIYYLFWLHHGGYCTKHPEKYPKIKRGWVLNEQTAGNSTIHRIVEEMILGKQYGN